MFVEIEIEGGRKFRGRVFIVSGGCVRVDFNYFYVGKYFVYEVEVVEKIDDLIEKVKVFIEFCLFRFDVNKVVIEVGEKDVVVDFILVREEVDKGIFVFGEFFFEGDFKFFGYEEVKFRFSVDEFFKLLEVEEGEVFEEEVSEIIEVFEEIEIEKVVE